ncbi:hypothetical protein SCB49_12459 [unidentified eubacterium SCB49]|nr:hypothetical protein SCB49_12459 [unidentified eubacterium SCB49]
MMAQESEPVDTLQTKIKHGLRLGVDIAKPFRSFIDSDYKGFQILGDFRYNKNMYLAAELGNETKNFYEKNLNAITSGSYIKLGVNFNTHKNWLGLNNSIYTGLRYGFATFKQELLAYQVYVVDQTFPANTVISNTEFTGLTAHWLEIQLGLKTEIAKNIFIDLHFELKRKIIEDTPDNFGNIYIPGFNQVNDFSEFGVGYGYSISYLIPIFEN